MDIEKVKKEIEETEETIKESKMMIENSIELLKRTEGRYYVGKNRRF